MYIDGAFAVRIFIPHDLSVYRYLPSWRADPFYQFIGKMFVTYRAITYGVKTFIIVHFSLYGGFNGFRFGAGFFLFRFRAYLRFYTFYVGRNSPA